MSQTNPALVTQLAVRRLPRWVLLVLGLAYVLPGFIGRDPWRQSDLAAFGAMLDLSQHPAHWSEPQVLGEPAHLTGWLPYWLGALAIRALPMLPADVAARLPFGLLLVLTMAFTWYAMYQFARQPAAQPLAFAFGGEARPKDYARAMADAAVLALIASLGLALLSHETTPTAAQLCFSAMLLYSGSRLGNDRSSESRGTVGAWWLASFGLALSGAMGLALAFGLGSLALLWGIKRHSSAHALLPASRLLACTLGSVCATALGAWLSGSFFPFQFSIPDWGAYDSWRSLGRLLVWFTWPAGLLALWTLWRWRGRWNQPHLILPLWWAVAALGAMVMTGVDDRTLVLALPALACLAALALPTLSRGVTALIDWFALLFFTGGAIVVWTVYVSMKTGIPAKPAANVAKLAPGFQPEFSWMLLLPAVLATLAWLFVLAWRIGKHKPALWKSLVLSATGGTVCWVLLMTLWLPMLNFGLGQAPISHRIAAVTPPGQCVYVFGLNQDQITGLQHHGKLVVHRWPGDQGRTACSLLVLLPAAYSTVPSGALDGWSLMRSIPRLRDNRDHLMVFERLPEQ